MYYNYLEEEQKKQKLKEEYLLKKAANESTQATKQTEWNIYWIAFECFVFTRFIWSSDVHVANIL